MRAIDIAVLVGQAVAAVADDRLDAAGKVCGAILMLYGICCTFARGRLLWLPFRCEAGSPRITVTRFWQPANAFACAQRFPVLDGIEEPIRRDAEGNRILTCGNTREKAAAPGDVHAVVRAGQTHLPERRGQHHDYAAGHLAVAATLWTPALHDERGPCGSKL